jgi:hypothetical protein
LNVSEPGLSESPGLLAINNTGTTCGLLLAVADATVTLPLYVPAEIPLVLTDTLIFPGVDPACESIPIHRPLPPAEAAAALNPTENELPSIALLDKFRLSGPGAVHPIW